MTFPIAHVAERDEATIRFSQVFLHSRLCQIGEVPRNAQLDKHVYLFVLAAATMIH